jgi:hypothetical protein
VQERLPPCANNGRKGRAPVQERLPHSSQQRA